MEVRQMASKTVKNKTIPDVPEQIIEETSEEWQLVGSMELVCDLEDSCEEFQENLKRSWDRSVSQLFE